MQPDPTDGVRSSGIGHVGSTPPPTHRATEPNLPPEPGAPTPAAKIQSNAEKVSKQHKTGPLHTLAVIAKGGARGLALITGYPLFVASGLIGGALSVIVMTPALLLGVAGIMANRQNLEQLKNNPKDIKKEIAISLLPAAPLIALEAVVMIPKVLLLATTGTLGANLLTFGLGSDVVKHAQRMKLITLTTIPLVGISIEASKKIAKKLHIEHSGHFMIQSKMKANAKGKKVYRHHSYGQKPPSDADAKTSKAFHDKMKQAQNVKKK